MDIIELQNALMRHGFSHRAFNCPLVSQLAGAAPDVNLVTPAHVETVRLFRVQGHTEHLYPVPVLMICSVNK